MWPRKSIASRVFLGLLGVGFGILLLVGAALYVRVQTILFAALDQDLESDLNVFTGLLVVEQGNLAFEPVDLVAGPFAIPRSGHYYQIRTESDGVVASVSLAGTELDLQTARRIRSDETAQLAVYNMTGPAGEPLRVMERSGEFAGRSAQIVVAHSMHTALRMLDRLRGYLVALGAVGSLGIGVLGWVISRRALRPLDDFANRVRCIREPNAIARFEPGGLHHEVAALADAFNAMLDRLRRSFQARDELLSDVSHELKTPITVIRSHCDIYLQRNREPAEYAEALRVIRETADSMSGAIRRLLALAQTKADLLQALALRPVDLIECLRRARRLHDWAARDKGIEISEHAPPQLFVRAEPDRLMEAFSCLLDNAVKYTPTGGVIALSVGRTDGTAEVRIADSGPGLEEQELEKIFERWYRGCAAGAEEGTGIGLHLVKTILEAHGGAVTVQNAVHRGSVFVVTLPVLENQDIGQVQEGVPSAPRATA